MPTDTPPPPAPASVPQLPAWRWRLGLLVGTVLCITASLCALWVQNQWQQAGMRAAHEDARAMAHSVAHTLAQQLARAVRLGIALPQLPGVPEHLEKMRQHQNMLTALAVVPQGAATALYAAGAALPPTPGTPGIPPSDGDLHAPVWAQAAIVAEPAQPPVGTVWVAAQATLALRDVQQRASPMAALLVLLCTLGGAVCAARGPGAQWQAQCAHVHARLLAHQPLPETAEAVDITEAAHPDGLQQLAQALAHNDAQVASARAQVLALAQELRAIDFDGAMHSAIAQAVRPVQAPDLPPHH